MYCLSPPLNIGTIIFFLRLSIPGQVVDHGHLVCFSDLFVEPFAKDSSFYTSSYFHHASHHPVSSICAAEIMAASEAIDGIKVLKSAISRLYELEALPIAALDLHDLFNSPPTLHETLLMRVFVWTSILFRTSTKCKTVNKWLRSLPI